MKRLPFRLVEGSLIAAILGLIVVAAGLTFAILDEEVSLQSIDDQWPTVTAGPRTIPSLLVSPTPAKTETPIIPLKLPTVPQTFVPDQQSLPYPHPDVGPNPLPCSDCHQIVHGGGG